MDDATMLLLGWAAGTVSTFVGLISYAKVIQPAKASGWRPLKVGRLESTSELTAIVARDVPPARPVGGYKQNNPAPVIFNASTPTPRTIQDAYRFNLQRDDGTTKIVLLPARHLLTFVCMPELKRKNWTGSNDVYTDVIAVASSRGWIQPRSDGLNGWEWADGMSTLARRVMRLADEKINLPAPNPTPATA